MFVSIRSRSTPFWRLVPSWPVARRTANSAEFGSSRILATTTVRICAVLSAAASIIAGNWGGNGAGDTTRNPRPRGRKSFVTRNAAFPSARTASTLHQASILRRTSILHQASTFRRTSILLETSVMLRTSMLGSRFLPAVGVERPRMAARKCGMQVLSRQRHFLPLYPPNDMRPGPPAERPRPKAMGASRTWFVPSCQPRSLA